MKPLTLSAVAATLCVLLTSEAVAQPQIVRQINGPASNEKFGQAVALLGDLDGDGIRDHAIGAPDGNFGGMTNNGYVNLHSGATGATINPLPLAGGATNDHFGNSICNLRDVTGDGVDEFVVGAPGDYGNPGVGVDGYARVYDGATRAVLFTLTPGTPLGGMGFGFAVCTANTDGTGTDEILVGAPFWDGSVPGNFQGAVMVHSGLTGASITGFTGAFNSNLGWSVSNIGDIGTGAQSVVAGAPGLTGATTSYVEVYQGNAGGVPTWYDYLPDFSGVNFGYSVSGIALEPTGMSSGFVVGSLFGNQVHAYQTDLSSSYFTWLYTLNGRPGSAFAQSWGASLAAAGDVNADGVPDFIAGTSSSASGIAYARIHSGDVGTKLYTHYGKRTANDAHAEGVSAAGDGNGNGRDSVLIGAPLWESNSGSTPTNGGRVVLVDLN